MKAIFNLREQNIVYNGGFILSIFNVHETRSRDWNIDQGETYDWRMRCPRTSININRIASFGVSKEYRASAWSQNEVVSTRGTSEIYEY